MSNLFLICLREHFNRNLKIYIYMIGLKHRLDPKSLILVRKCKCLSWPVCIPFVFVLYSCICSGQYAKHGRYRSVRCKCLYLSVRYTCMFWWECYMCLYLLVYYICACICQSYESICIGQYVRQEARWPLRAPTRGQWSGHPGPYRLGCKMRIWLL